MNGLNDFRYVRPPRGTELRATRFFTIPQLFPILLYISADMEYSILNQTDLVLPFC